MLHVAITSSHSLMYNVKGNEVGIKTVVRESHNFKLARLKKGEEI